MKTKSKLSATLLLFAVLLIPVSQMYSQGFYNGLSPTRTEVQSYYSYFDFTYNPSGSGAGTDITGMGVNNTAPSYMFDILCDPSVPTNMDINVSSLAYGSIPANAAGYRIGGNYVLWHNGDISSIFVGVGAGSSGGTGLYNNTVTGHYAQPSNTSGYGNSVYGSYAHYSNTTGRRNTVVGDSALHTTQIADSDVAIGYQSLYKYNPTVGPNMINTAVGNSALFYVHTS